jgi:capsular exopolysaccharide synthesis family protein
MFVNKKETNFDNNIQPSKIENLDILCAGPTPPNPSELLSSPKFENGLNEVFEKYDVVIVDTPPLIAVTDALLLRKYFDELLLIVRLNKTEKGALDRSMKNLENIGFPLKYCVLNEVSGSNYYGSYYSYQYYYGNDSEES